MDRLKIKAKAKSMINSKLFDLWKPMIYIIGIEIIFGIIINAMGVEPNSSFEAILNLIVSFLMAPLSIGVYIYMLKFVRNKRYSIQDIFSQFKNFISIILITFLVGFFVTLWSVLLLIPGIIAALGYSMVSYLIADGSLDVWGTLKESQEMMKGYKWDYFIFNLSFLGWIILGMLTFGIAFIYVIPYINIANTLYYEELNKKR